MRYPRALLPTLFAVEFICGTSAWLGTSRPVRTRYRRHSPISLGVQTTQEGSLLTRNLTDGGSALLPSMGRSIISNVAVVHKEEGESWRRAVHHANAILDVYNETGGGLSQDLIATTLENVVYFSIENPSKVTGQLLEDVESLVWRLRGFQMVPSDRVLGALWEMQRSYRESRSEKASKQVGRHVNLLTHWKEWSERTQAKRVQQMKPPPQSYLLEVLQYAIEEKVSMSFSLWDLYTSFSEDAADSCSREVYARVLQILAHSPSIWRLRQCHVCHDMIVKSHQKATEAYWPSPNEIKQALEAAASVGRAEDAAWLLRMLDLCPKNSVAALQECRTLFVKALMYSEEPGSLLYLEELLSSDQWQNDTLPQWKLLLMKCARSKSPQCGERATKIFYKIQKRYQEKGEAWMPDFECAYNVVQSYLNDPDHSLKHVLKATNFTKRYLVSYNLTQSRSDKPLRLFDTLLAAFDEHARSDPEAVKAADDLFRFYLVQHRDGRVPNETPDQFHLGHILRYYNRQYNKYLLKKGASKSLEYFRLFCTLAEKKIVASPPDLFNVRQLLGTLSRSGEPGYGIVANKTLTDALVVESPIHPYALGHMFWCVIKCYCSDGRPDKAFAILQRWENAFAAKPSMVRLTGAPYQTLIHALAGQPGPETVSMTFQVLDKLERQLQNGNERIVLRSKLYKEALQCCQYDLSAQEGVHQFFSRQNFTKLELETPK